MASFECDVTLVTAPRFTGGGGGAYARDVAAEDGLIAEALSELGFNSRRAAWDDTRLDWSRTRLVLLRATWDYFERLDAFTAWLARVEAATTLVNAPGLVRWNLDKRYLADLRRAGLPVTPTRYVPRGSTVRLAALLAESGWGEAVVKPAVSASGWETHRVGAGEADAFEPRYRRLARDNDLLVQPFLAGVAEHGEVSCVVIGGRFTHAVRKRAAPGGFLVQAEHGGTVEDHAAPAALVALAERAVAALPRPPAYARVDLVPADDGDWLVGELELIEPELWLRRHPPAARALAREIAERLAAGETASAQR